MRFLTHLAKTKTLEQLTAYICFLIYALFIIPDFLTAIYLVLDHPNLEPGQINWVPVILLILFTIPILLIIFFQNRYNRWCSIVAESIGITCVYWDDRSQCLPVFKTYNPNWFRVFISCYKVTKEHYQGKKKEVIKVIDKGAVNGRAKR